MIKKLMAFFFLVLGFGLTAQEVSQKPFWEQDVHFQQYACLMIESSIGRIEAILDQSKKNEIDDNVKNKINEELDLIKYIICGKKTEQLLLTN